MISVHHCWVNCGFYHFQCSSKGWKCNVNDTISWRGHRDRVMQLNWHYFRGICQMMSLRVWPNTDLGCNPVNLHAPVTVFMFSCSWTNVLPDGMTARVSPVQSIEHHRILAPTRDSNQRPLGLQSRTVTIILPMHTRAWSLSHHFEWYGLSPLVSIRCASRVYSLHLLFLYDSKQNIIQFHMKSTNICAGFLQYNFF